MDEIYVNLMNREIQDINFKDNINQIICKEESASKILAQLFMELANYILLVQEKISGKFYFEILVSYAFDEEKQKKLLSTLLYKQNLVYFQTKVKDFF